ncbi:pyrrolo-quinoline quinone [Natronococcus pandeyae]|uniref:Pyrrolo-quinoline quinone n=1 Tax=Natronococcus pandeyae TaxID=2055836 RepID=A0A8J8TRB4_9EURY|nr:PQQ-binding-like beta-propeller repeat protein [Natronococcus pandeyae]TYL39368.1 pyrrolo-quinoline quinone [Natronococcus pandeyae]
MADWKRRSVLAAGAALSTSGILASIGAAETGSDNGRVSVEKSDGWSSHGGTTGNTRYVPSESGFSKPDTIAWQYDETGNVTAVDGMVYLQTDGEVHAIDANDGSNVWTSTNGHNNRTPAVANGTVYVTGEQLTAIDAESGSVRWSEAFGSDASVSAPLVTFETVYAAVDGSLYAFDATDGSLRWEHESVTVTSRTFDDDDPVETNYVFNTSAESIAATEEAVWALLDERRSEADIDADAIVAIDPLSGEIQWADRLEPGNFTNSLTVADGALYVSNKTEEGVTALESDTGETVAHISDALMTAANNGQVVTRGRHSLKLTGPETSWERNGTYSYGPPTIVGETIVIAHSLRGPSMPDELVGIDLGDGNDEWQFTFDESQWMDGFDIECVVDDGMLYVNRKDGLTALCSAR